MLLDAWKNSDRTLRTTVVAFGSNLEAVSLKIASTVLLGTPEVQLPAVPHVALSFPVHVVCAQAPPVARTRPVNRAADNFQFNLQRDVFMMFVG